MHLVGGITEVITQVARGKRHRPSLTNKDSCVRCQHREVLDSMIPWNNKIMKTHGRSIRAKIVEAYRQSFARACIVSIVEKKKQELRQAKLLNDYMNNLPDDKWGHT
jgi:hypothetical protein